MPDPQPHPESARMKRVATHALVAGLLIMACKFVVFGITNSAAVLSDALESIINVAAAAFMLYTVWLANRPADAEHPYGHGKIEFMAVGLEGWMILLAGLVIVVESVRRLIWPPNLNTDHFLAAAWGLGVVAVFAAALAAYVYATGHRHGSATLVADGKHLATDALSTLGGVVSLALITRTGKLWIDPLIALATAGVILATSWNLLWQSAAGLMDRIDLADDHAIRAILDEEVRTNAIRGYHKVRHRHSGPFHWVELHLQVDPEMNVRAAHELASRIEFRIEQRLGQGQADATAHVEPYDPPAPGIPPTGLAASAASSPRTPNSSY